MSKFKPIVIGLIVGCATACAKKPSYEVPPTKKGNPYGSADENVTGQFPNPFPETPGQDGERRLISDLEVLQLIQSDVNSLRSGEATKVRYFSLAVVANRGENAALLEAQRDAFKKSLNSISQKESDVKPVTLGSDQLFFRVNVEDLGLTAPGFDKIVAEHYPFNLRFRDVGTSESILAEKIDTSVRTQLKAENAVIRMDWWNAAAMLPHVFGKFKAFPAILSNLEKDFPGNIEEFMEDVEADEAFLKTFRYYNQPMSRSAVAAELGFSERDLVLLLTDNEVSGSFNALSSRTGTIARGTFQSVYPKVIFKFKHEFELEAPRVSDFLETADCAGPGGDGSCDIVPQREIISISSAL